MDITDSGLRVTDFGALCIEANANLDRFLHLKGRTVGSGYRKQETTLKVARGVLFGDVGKRGRENASMWMTRVRTLCSVESW